ncbi:hypothetical protein [Pseudomonas sp. Ant30-3]|uniref:hypothetical protein n=1 Tax=Pseudomonas sp. Ant30-3 TaxID=1488328 RepID=UPI00067BCDCF|nr:hypothetical protein [Pseudomonas sp. Ant30-3]
MHWTKKNDNPTATTLSISTADSAAAGFFISFCAYMVVQLYMNVQVFPFDAGNYWALSAHIWDFSFPQQMRGYFYPLLLSPFKFLHDNYAPFGLLMFKICTSVFYAYFFAVLFPRFFSTIFGGKLTTLSRSIPSILIAIIFPGLICYPLSDAPSLALIIGAAALVLSGIKSETNIKRFGLFFIAGMLAYFAYNTRTIYLFSIVALCLLIFFTAKLHITKRAIGVLAFLFGACLGAVPQMAVNKGHYDNPSPLIITDLGNGSLFLSQLMWGIVVDRYETYTPVNAPGTPVFYANSAGENLLLHTDARKITSITDYLKLVMTHPLTFASIYARHIASGLDVRDGEVYTQTPSHQKSLRSIFSLAVVILGITQFLRLLFSSGAFSPAGLVEKLGWTTVLLIACIAVIPGAVETRFFFPVFYVCLVAMVTGFQKDLLGFKGYQLILTALITLSVYAFVQQSIQNPIYDRPESRMYNYSPGN